MRGLIVPLLLLALACASDPQRMPERETTPPLPPIPATAAPGADAPDAYVPLVEGVVTRTRFTAEDAVRHRIEVRDLIVAPNRRGAETQFPGAAILLVRQGRGVVRGIAEGELAPGRTLSIPHGTRFSLENASDKHLVIRAYVLIPR